MSNEEYTVDLEAGDFPISFSERAQTCTVVKGRDTTHQEFAIPFAWPDKYQIMDNMNHKLFNDLYIGKFEPQPDIQWKLYQGFDSLYMADPAKQAIPAPVPVQSVGAIAYHHNSGIKVGDTVRVTAKSYHGELGWDNMWNPEMDRSINHIFKVLYINDQGVRLETSGFFGIFQDFSYPWFVLRIEQGLAAAPVPVPSEISHTFGKGDRVLVYREPKEKDGYDEWTFDQQSKLYAHGRVIYSDSFDVTIQFSDFNNDESEDVMSFPYFVLQKF